MCQLGQSRGGEVQRQRGWNSQDVRGHVDVLTGTKGLHKGLGWPEWPKHSGSMCKSSRLWYFLFIITNTVYIYIYIGWVGWEMSWSRLPLKMHYLQRGKYHPRTTTVTVMELRWAAWTHVLLSHLLCTRTHIVLWEIWLANLSIFHVVGTGLDRFNHSEVSTDEF